MNLWELKKAQGLPLGVGLGGEEDLLRSYRGCRVEPSVTQHKAPQTWGFADSVTVGSLCNVTVTRPPACLLKAQSM